MLSGFDGGYYIVSSSGRFAGVDRDRPMAKAHDSRRPVQPTREDRTGRQVRISGLVEGSPGSGGVPHYDFCYSKAVRSNFCGEVISKV